MEKCQLNWKRVNGAANRWTNQRSNADCSFFLSRFCLFVIFFFFVLFSSISFFYFIRRIFVVRAHPLSSRTNIFVHIRRFHRRHCFVTHQSIWLLCFYSNVRCSMCVCVCLKTKQELSSFLLECTPFLRYKIDEGKEKWIIYRTMLKKERKMETQKECRMGCIVKFSVLLYSASLWSTRFVIFLRVRTNLRISTATRNHSNTHIHIYTLYIYTS